MLEDALTCSLLTLEAVTEVRHEVLETEGSCHSRWVLVIRTGTKLLC